MITIHSNINNNIRRFGRSAVAAGAVMLFVISGCSSPSQKVENAKDELDQAKVELREEKRDSVMNYETFKRESQERINNNEKAIAAFRERMLTRNETDRAADQKIVDRLEQKNIDMRKKIEDYKENGKDEWAAFTDEFTHDMDELGNALKDLTVKNTK